MILTFTPHPSLDRSLELSTPLHPGSVQRVLGEELEAGGKGVNVAAMIVELGLSDIAPVKACISLEESAESSRRFLRLLAQRKVPYSLLPGRGVRENFTLASPSETTKLNSSAHTFDDSLVRDLAEAFLAEVSAGDTLVFSGSLPAGIPVSFYGDLAREAVGFGAWVVLDTSGPALAYALGVQSSEHDCFVDLFSPNLEELADADPRGGEELLSLADNPRALALYLRENFPKRRFLLSLGERGALVKTERGVWYAPAPRVPVRSTVGAGDAGLGGALWARANQLAEPEWLRWAVACGSAAVSMPGSQTPPYAEVCNLVVTIDVEKIV